jgi:hypothetical protein
MVAASKPPSQRLSTGLTLNIPGGFLRWGIPKTIGFNTEIVNLLDDLEVPAF